MIRESGTHAGSPAFRHRQRFDLAIMLAGCLIAVAVCAGGTTPETDSRNLPTVTITLSKATSSGTGATMSRPFLSSLAPSADAAATTVRRLVAIPECESASVEAIALRGGAGERRLAAADASRLVRIEGIAKIRDQTVAVLALTPGAFDDKRFLGSAWDEA
jgi:hypothetical protein